MALALVAGMTTKENEKHWEPLLGYVTEAEAERAFDNYYGCPTAQQDLIDNNLNHEQKDQPNDN